MQEMSITVQHVVASTLKTYEELVATLDALLGQQVDWDGLNERVLQSDASWNDVVQTTDSAIGKSGFTVFYKIDVGLLLSLSGKQKKARQYILGNPLIAIKLLEHTSEAALYVPLRLVVYADDEGNAFIAYDRPSSLLSVYQNEAIAQTARLLDDKLAQLVTTACA